MSAVAHQAARMLPAFADVVPAEARTGRAKRVLQRRGFRQFNPGLFAECFGRAVLRGRVLAEKFVLRICALASITNHLMKRICGRLEP
jgi:hypothetical protein